MDSKITALTELTTPASGDMLAIVDDPGGSPVTKKVEVDSLDDYLSASTKTLTNKTLTEPKLNEDVALTSTSTELNALDGKTGSWLTWIISWTNFTLGNGTVTSTYIQIGKIVMAQFNVTLGSTSSVSGAITFSLPVTAAAGNSANLSKIGYGSIYDNGTNTFDANVMYASTTTAKISPIITNATYAGSGNNTSSTIPMTWASTDKFTGFLVYQAA